MAQNAAYASNKHDGLEQGQLQYCFPETFSPLAPQGVSHCFPGTELGVPETRFPASRPLPFSLSDEKTGSIIMNPQPGFYGFDKNIYASVNAIDDRNSNLKRETTSPFDTDPGLTNCSSDDVSSLLYDQNSPETFEDATYTRTPVSGTLSSFPPLYWSCSPSSSVTSSSASSFPSTLPYAWNPSMRPADPAPFTGPSSTWPSMSSMPCLPSSNGNQQYSNPSSSANTNAGWESNCITGTPSTHETMMSNGLPLVDNPFHSEISSSPYAMNVYGGGGLEMCSFYASQRPRTVPFTYPGATVPTSVSLQDGNASSRLIPSRPQSQPMYPTATTFPNQIPTTTTATTIPVKRRDHIPQRQQLSQSTTDPNAATTTTATAPAPSATASQTPNSRNAFLIDCKRRGLSYKDIKRIGNFKEAESTLRGRFRTLTKSKGQRVRRPQWEDRDIYLLCEAVNIYSFEMEMHSHRRAHSSLGRLRGSPTANSGANSPSAAAAASGGPPRVSWKKVAQYIWTHGGSYHFGNATCKKKWWEVNSVDGGR